MGLNDPFALSRDMKVSVEPEATFDTYVKATAGGSIRPLSFSVTHDQPEKDRRDARPTRSRVERILGRKVVSWELESFILPFDPATADPSIDVHELLQAALGLATISAGVKTDFEPSDVQTGPQSISITAESNAVLMKAVAGAIVEDWSISIPGGDEPRIKFGGPCAREIVTSASKGDGSSGGMVTTAAGVGAVGTSFTVGIAGEARNFNIGSCIKVGAQDNSGAGYEVTTIVGDLVTFTPATVGAQVSAIAIIPFTTWIDTSTNGQPVTMLDGSLAIGADSTASSEIIPSAIEIVGKNNFVTKGEIPFKDRIIEVIPGSREIGGTITLLGRQRELIRVGRGREFDQFSTTIILGGAATGDPRVTILMPQLRLLASSMAEFPTADTDDEVTITLPFVAMSSTLTAKDEIKITVDKAP